MTDETAVEFAGWWTHANADIIRALEDKRGVVLTEDYARMIFARVVARTGARCTASCDSAARSSTSTFTPTSASA